MRFDENLYVKMTLTGASVDSDVIDLVTTKVTAATKIELQTSDDNSTYSAVGATSFAANDDVGTQKVIDVPPGCGRYLKLVATGTTMGGAVEAGFTLAAQSAKGIEAYAAN